MAAFHVLAKSKRWSAIQAKVRIESHQQQVASLGWTRVLVGAGVLALSAACDTATTSGSGSYDDPATAQPEPLRPDPGTIENGAPYSTRLARLTHREYDNTLRDVVGIDGHASDDFLEDPSFDGFDNNANRLWVSGF